MTLFEAVEGEGGVFTHVIEKYYTGRRDNKTLKILNQKEKHVQICNNLTNDWVGMRGWGMV